MNFNLINIFLRISLITFTHFFVSMCVYKTNLINPLILIWIHFLFRSSIFPSLTIYYGSLSSHAQQPHTQNFYWRKSPRGSATQNQTAATTAEIRQTHQSKSQNIHLFVFYAIRFSIKTKETKNWKQFLLYLSRLVCVLVFVFASRARYELASCWRPTSSNRPTDRPNQTSHPIHL